MKCRFAETIKCEGCGAPAATRCFWCKKAFCERCADQH